MKSYHRRYLISSARLLLAAATVTCCLPPAAHAQQDWRTLPQPAVQSILNGARLNGKVGGSFDLRVKSTDRSYNYKLRATWITPGVVAGAVGRSLMLSKGLPESEAAAVVRAIEGGEAGTSWLVLVELDPREGSGIIPSDWISRFGPAGDESRKVTGAVVAEEGIWHKILSAFARDYSYDRFLVRFPRVSADGKPVLERADVQAELFVQIYQKQGRVAFKVPAGLVDSATTQQ